MDNSDIKCYNNFGVSEKCAFTKLSRKRCRNYAFLGGFGLLFFGYGDKLFGACKKVGRAPLMPFGIVRRSFAGELFKGAVKIRCVVKAAKTCDFKLCQLGRL